MTRAHRSALLLLAWGVAAIAAHSVHAFLLVDACVDAGGRYLAEPPRCELAANVVRPLSALPRAWGWWLFVLVPAASVGVLVYCLGRALIRRATHVAG